MMSLVSSRAAAAKGNRVGSTDRGRRSHRRHIGRQSDERPGACRAPARGRDINNSRHFVAEKFLDDFPR